MDLQDLISQMGYRQDSPFLGNPYNDIHTPDGSIDMSETPFDLWGTDEHGNKKKMKAFSKKKYKFPGKIVREIPVAQKGGSARDLAASMMNRGESTVIPKNLIEPLVDKEQFKRAQMALSSNSKRDSLKSISKKEFDKKAGVADILRNPLTALKYKIKGQDIPSNFQKGDRNIYDNVVDVLNPMFYANSAKNLLINIAHPINTSKTLTKAAINAVTQISDNRNVFDDGSNGEALSIIGDIANLLPLVSPTTKVIRPYLRNLNYTAGELIPALKEATNVFRGTSDLPFVKRLSNAKNAGLSELHMNNDIRGHSYFNLTPEEVAAKISAEKAQSLAGTLHSDSNMSLNSAPLYYNTAARDAEKFVPVRTTKFNPVNKYGFQGKRIDKAIPDYIKEKHSAFFDEYKIAEKNANELYNRQAENINSYPEQYRQTLMDDLMRDKKRSLDEYNPNKRILERISNGPMSLEDAQGLNQFVDNYKPNIDNTIKALNNKTGLNIPLSRINKEGWLDIPEVHTINNPSARVKDYYNNFKRSMNAAGRESLQNIKDWSSMKLKDPSTITRNPNNPYYDPDYDRFDIEQILRNSLDINVNEPTLFTRNPINPDLHQEIFTPRITPNLRARSMYSHQVPIDELPPPPNEINLVLKKGGLTKQQIYDYLFKESSIPNYEDEDVPEEETTQQEPQKVIETDLVKEQQMKNQEYEQAIALAMGDDYNPGSSVLAGGTGLAMNMKPLYQNTTGNYTQSSGEPEVGSDKGQFAFNYLQEKYGLPAHVAAGIVGNFELESGNFRDDVIAGTKAGDQGTSFGIAQWHIDKKKKHDRWTPLINYAKEQGKDPYTLPFQLDYAIHEAKQRGDLAKVMKTKTTEEAANTFRDLFERPLNKDNKRAKLAKKYHPYKYGGIYDEILNEL